MAGVIIDSQRNTRLQLGTRDAGSLRRTLCGLPSALAQARNSELVVLMTRKATMTQQEVVVILPRSLRAYRRTVTTRDMGLGYTRDTFTGRVGRTSNVYLITSRAW